MTNLWREGPKKEKLETGHPPYLKVWIRHWFVPLEHSLSNPEWGQGPTISSGSFSGKNGLWADLIVGRGPYLVTWGRLIEKHIVH